MWKAIKLIFGLLVLLAIGLGYGKFNKAVQEQQEETFYSYISFSYPGNVVSSVHIKRTPKSKCEKWRRDYFEASMGECKGCVVLANDCRREIAEIYEKALQQQELDISYIYKPYTYPEVSVFKGLPDDAFSQLCEMEIDSLESTTCFE